MRYAASVSATSVATSCYAPSPTAYAALAAAFPSPLSVTTRAAASIVTPFPTTITRSWFPTVRSSLHYSSHWRHRLCEQAVQYRLYMWWPLHIFLRVRPRAARSVNAHRSVNVWKGASTHICPSTHGKVR